MKSLGLYPPPDPPYKELSYDYMWRSLIDMQGPRCGTMFHGKNTLVVHKCQFMDKTKGLLRTLEARVVGLKLDTCRPGSRPIHN